MRSFPQQWLAQLEAVLAECGGHPSQALLGLWKGMAAGDAGEATPVFEVSKTEAAVGVMRGVMSLDRERVLAMWRWVQADVKS